MNDTRNARQIARKEDAATAQQQQQEDAQTASERQQIIDRLLGIYVAGTLPESDDEERQAAVGADSDIGRLWKRWAAQDAKRLDEREAEAAQVQAQRREDARKRKNQSTIADEDL